MSLAKKIICKHTCADQLLLSKLFCACVFLFTFLKLLFYGSISVITE